MRTMRWITQRLLSPLTLALVIVATAMLYPTPAAATETLDQAQPISQSFATVSSSVPRAQIFTTGQYFGLLDRVSLYLENYSASPPTGALLTISVQTVIGGLPSGKQIGSGTIPLSAIPPPGLRGWVDVSIRGAYVVPGTQYALVLQTSQVFARVNWWEAYGKYAGGVMALNDGNGWRIDLPEDDFTFKTYVVPDTLDQSQPTGGGGNRLGMEGVRLGQTFTAGLSGVLDRVRVYLGYPYISGPLGVTIETVTGGFPSGIVIGQGSVPASAIPPQYGWVSIGINGATVNAGAQYALVLHASGSYLWSYGCFTSYTGGNAVLYSGGWMVDGYSGCPMDAVFETYVVPAVASAPPPLPPATITPCSSGVCPVVTGKVTPPDSTARVTSNVGFQELPDGTVHGVLHFDDSKTGNFALQGCSTTSAACRLTVTTFACTDQHAITVAGAYTPKGEAAGNYVLTLSGAKDGIGTFTLTAGDYTYTLTHNGIVDVTCPPR